MAKAGSSVSELLQTYQKDIAHVAECVAKHLDEQKDDELNLAAKEFPVDDFCILKFVLSAQRKKPRVRETAIDNLIKTIHWRKDRKDLMKIAKETEEMLYYIPIALGGFLGDELVHVTFVGAADLHELVKKWGSGEVALSRALIASEQARLILDKRSRETGRLSKLLAVADMEGLSIRKIANKTMLGVMGHISKTNEINTPQLLSRVVILNAPSFFQLVVTMFKPFVSKSTMEKLAICPGKKSKQSIAECPFIARIANGVQSVPESVGGSMKAPVFGGITEFH